MTPARSQPIPPTSVALPPESENYAPFAHVLRVVVLPHLSGPEVVVRVFCVNCGLRVQAEGILRLCEPEIPPREGK